METRDSAHALGLQMQAFYDHYHAGAGAFPPFQPSPLQPQQPSPHHHHLDEQRPPQQHYLHHQHHFHHQQQQQPQQHQQVQQHHHQQQQQQHPSRNSLNPPTIHSPAPLRQVNPTTGLNLNPNPNPNPSPVTNLNHNSSSGVSTCYPPETPPHMMPHQLQAASSSPLSGVGMSMSPGLPMTSGSAPTFKRKRGRPRKYATDGNSAAALISLLNPAPPAEKKDSRGPNKKKKAQASTSGTTGQGFTPHVLTVGAGEDITERIMTFSQHGPWAVCILSANGAISKASLWHSGISSGIVTYEGRFEILSLSGLFLLTEDGSTRSRSGGFSVSLAGQDGTVIGGRVAGVLIAATPIQVIIGTFSPENRRIQAKALNAPPSGGTGRASMLMVDRTQLDASGPGCLQGPIPAGAVTEERGASHVMPLQSGNWGFDVETRSHSAQI